MISIQSIAKGLSKDCRFAGQIDGYYSPAQHSVMVRSVASLPRHLKIYALLHDAAEGFLKDMAKPIKLTLGDYQLLEDRVMTVIADRFHLPHGFHKHPAVKEADDLLLVTEAAQMFNYEPPWIQDYIDNGIEPIPALHIQQLEWRDALAQFLLHFNSDYRAYMEWYRFTRTAAV